MQRTPAQRVHGRAPRGVVDLAADHLGAGPRPPRSSERFELVESGTLGRADAMMESTAGEACSLGQRIGVSGTREPSTPRGACVASSASRACLCRLAKMGL